MQAPHIAQELRTPCSYADTFVHLSPCPGNRGDNRSALSTILTDCPYGEDVEEAKVSSGKLPFIWDLFRVIYALSSVASLWQIPGDTVLWRSVRRRWTGMFVESSFCFVFADVRRIAHAVGWPAEQRGRTDGQCHTPSNASRFLCCSPAS